LAPILGSGWTVEDTSNAINCAESRMGVWSENGVPFEAHLTALCEKVAVNFHTVGQEYTQDLIQTFGRLFRAKNAM
jgi:hypothetical protein